ncbi:hypothetical protein [Hymenobacter ruber]
MSDYVQRAAQFRAALLPLRDYAQRERGKIDLADPKQSFRFRHVQALETALETAVSFGATVHQLLHPPPTPAFLALQARVLRCHAIQQNPSLAHNPAFPCPRPNPTPSLT